MYSREFFSLCFLSLRLVQKNKECNSQVWSWLWSHMKVVTGKSKTHNQLSFLTDLFLTSSWVLSLCPASSYLLSDEKNKNAGRPLVLQMWYLHPWGALEWQEHAVCFYFWGWDLSAYCVLNLVSTTTPIIDESWLEKNTEYLFHCFLLGSIHQVRLTLSYLLAACVYLPIPSF